MSSVEIITVMFLRKVRIVLDAQINKITRPGLWEKQLRSANGVFFSAGNRIGFNAWRQHPGVVRHTYI